MVEAPQDPSSLRPADDIQRILISTTSRFTGVYESDGVRLDHAWMPLRGAYHVWDEGPTSRSTYVLSFRTPPSPEPKAGVVIPDWSPTGDFIAALLSVLFGKRIEAHGSLENCGSFGMPDVSAFSTTCLPGVPHNTHKPRADVPLPLTLGEVRRMEDLWNIEHHDDAATFFFTACRFYQRALVAADRDPEIAYLHLITAGEILSQAWLPKSDERLLDDDLEAAMSQVTIALNDRGKLARTLRNRLFEVKRRFVATFEALVDAPFFERGEAEDLHSRLSRDKFAATMGAAYAVRSLNVHSGQSIGAWMRPFAGLNEVQIGRPVVRNPELANALADAPTLIGLERVTRYALLRYAQMRLGVDLDIPAEEPAAVGES